MSRILDFLFFITWRKACASRKGVSFLTRLYHIGHLHSETAVENATKGSILTSELMLRWTDTLQDQSILAMPCEMESTVYPKMVFNIF